MKAWPLSGSKLPGPCGSSRFALAPGLLAREAQRRRLRVARAVRQRRGAAHEPRVEGDVDLDRAPFVGDAHALALGDAACRRVLRMEP